MKLTENKTMVFESTSPSPLSIHHMTLVSDPVPIELWILIALSLQFGVGVGELDFELGLDNLEIY